MNLVADESVDGPIVAALRREGHVVHYVAELAAGIPDNAVAEIAEREQAVLLTADKDFGELFHRMHRVSTGVVLIRLAGLTPQQKADVVVAAITRHAGELDGAFAVVGPGAIRVRRPI
jgi:predicted nuclease of predicted toxin-antitoxin system